VSRYLAIGLFVVLTAVAGGSAWGMNVLLARVVAVEEQAPTPEGAASTVVAATHVPTSTPSRALTVDQYLDGIMGRNIFDIAMIDAWATRNPTPGGEGVTKTELHLKLVATMPTDPPEYSIAAIAEEATPNMPSVYGINDVIQDRTVVSIADDRVGLKRSDGTIEYLMLDGGDVATAVASSDDSSSGSPGEGVKQVAENKFEVSKDLFDKYLSDPESIAGLGRALLHRGPDGEYDGYRLSAIRRNTIADQLGIKNGDIIKSVNGQPLNSMQAAMGAYTTMRTQSSFCFQISRRGSPQELCYDVK
jgi:general secretion pathway protein C